MKKIKRHVAKKSVSVGLSLALTVGTFGLGFKSPLARAYADQDNQANNPSVVQEQPKVSDVDNPKKSQPKQEQKQDQKQSQKQSDSKAQTVVAQNSTNTNETKTPVSYMDWNDPAKQLEEKTLSDYKSLDSGDRNLTNDKWYVVDSNITFGERMYCWGNDVHLVLKDGCTLNAEHGIECSNGTKISIYGQAGMTGTLNATGTGKDAGIGGLKEREGSNIVVNGGRVNATGGDNGGAAIGGSCDRTGYNITINAGNVEAKGSRGAAAIGGGIDGFGKNITINGGTVNAVAYAGGSGIGGGNGREGQIITINNGNVTSSACGGGAAGIGGGINAGGQIITINGGKVHAYGGEHAAGIGGGQGGYGKNITVTGGDIYANSTGESEASGIGRGEGEQASNIHLAEKMKLKVGNVSPASNYYDHPGIDGDSAYRFNTPNRQCVHLYYEEDPTIKYMDWNDSIKQLEEKTITNYVTLGSFERNLVEDKWYVVEDDITYSDRMYCYGHNVHLIIKDGVTLNANKGIDCSRNAKINIYGQAGMKGTLNAEGDWKDAGIGGFNKKHSGAITINGGIINATGGTYAAGIGGGDSGEGQNITINGGTVTAEGGSDGFADGGAGIGGGRNGGSQMITINGGLVDVKAGPNSAGIGGGMHGYAKGIYINGGKVNAVYGSGGGCCAIGCGSSGKKMSQIYINEKLSCCKVRHCRCQVVRELVDHRTNEDISYKLWNINGVDLVKVGY